MSTERQTGVKWPFAAPSWVMPGSILENAIFLQDKVGEIGLCLFESAACLRYGPDDLPEALVRPGLSWHVHLPLDLVWDGSSAFDTCCGLAEATGFLCPRFWVLHPPMRAENPWRSLEFFAANWQCAGYGQVLLENVGSLDPDSLPLAWLESLGFGFCLDFAHAHGHAPPLQFAARASLFHWSAGLGGDAHASLGKWTAGEFGQARELLAVAPAGATHMPEVFQWQAYEESAAILHALLAGSA